MDVDSLNQELRSISEGKNKKKRMLNILLNKTKEKPAKSPDQTAPSKMVIKRERPALETGEFEAPTKVVRKSKRKRKFRETFNATVPVYEKEEDFEPSDFCIPITRRDKSKCSRLEFVKLKDWNNHILYSRNWSALFLFHLCFVTAFTLLFTQLLFDLETIS